MSKYIQRRLPLIPEAVHAVENKKRRVQLGGVSTFSTCFQERAMDGFEELQRLYGRSKPSRMDA
jgi:hypothetical protein